MACHNGSTINVIMVIVIAVIITILILASESLQKGSNAPSVSSLVVDEEKMMPGH